MRSSKTRLTLPGQSQASTSEAGRHGGVRPGTMRIALIGCGAIARALHLPALARLPQVLDNLVLVDPDLDRARSLGDDFGVASVAPRYQDAADHVDAAIITVPHHLHYPIALDLVQRGVHVLCEKPLTETHAQAEELISAAQQSGAVVAANYTKRLYPAYQRVRQLIEDGTIGVPEALEFYWGEVFDWPASSGFYFGRLGSGKGVLLDKGAHIVDLVTWWLPGKATLIRCLDDSRGGSEAVSEVHLQIGECLATLRLSWLSRYENTFTIRGDAGTIDGGVFDWKSIRLTRSGRPPETIRSKGDAHSPAGFGPALIDDFLDAVASGARPLIPGDEVVESIRIIEECYTKRERFPAPWDDPREVSGG